MSQHDCAVANTVRDAMGVPMMGITHGPDPSEREPEDAGAASVDASAPHD